MTARPRLGFLGAGWIGRMRMRAVAEDARARVVAIADPDPGAREECRIIAPEAELVESYDELLASDIDAVVIATPSGQHAVQCVRALERGLGVFCQKPLGRTAAEVEAITGAARRANRPLGVDLCYREAVAFRALRELVASGALGRPYAVDATFHNAYGPDRAWANDPLSAGGGCLIDLGVHLLDLALALLPEAEPTSAVSSLYAGGGPLEQPPRAVEDYACGQLVLAGGGVVRLACSWRSSFGAEACIRVMCVGSEASAAFENVGGSFYDFRCVLYRGRERKELSSPPDAWGGRTILAWIDALSNGDGYRHDPRLSRVAAALDRLYGRDAGVAERSRHLAREAV